MLALLFVEVNQAIVSFLQAMSFSRKCGTDLPVDETLTSKNQRNIALLIEEDLIRGERIFMSGPACIHSEFWNKVISRRVEGLMFHRSDHGCREPLIPFSRSVTDNSGYTRHILL